MLENSPSRDPKDNDLTGKNLPPSMPASWSDSVEAYFDIVKGLSDGSFIKVMLYENLKNVGVIDHQGKFTKYDTPEEFFNELKTALLFKFEEHGQILTEARLPYVDSEHKEMIEVPLSLKVSNGPKGDWRIETLTGPPLDESKTKMERASADPGRFLSQVESLVRDSNIRQSNEFVFSLTTRNEKLMVEIQGISDKDSMHELCKHIRERLHPIVLIPIPTRFEFERYRDKEEDLLDKALDVYTGPWDVIVMQGPVGKRPDEG